MPSYPNLPQATHNTARSRLRRRLLALLAGRQHSPQPHGSSPQRLLLIRPDHLGDVLFCGPALHWLREHHPEARITLAMGPWARAALPAVQGAVDEVLEIPFPAFERGQRAGLVRRWTMLPAIARQWRTYAFSAAVILRPDHWWGALASRLASIPHRWGYALPDTSPWLNHALPYRYEHAAAANLRLVQSLCAEKTDPDPLRYPLRFAVASDWQQQAEAILHTAGIAPHTPFVIIHPGSGAPVKLWTPAQWAQVGQALRDEGMAVVVTGGPGEEALCKSIAGACTAVDLGGKTSFGVLAALMQRARAVLGVDSGPLHLAVAVGAPTVHLFGPADDVRFGPWGEASKHIVLRSDWTCAPCEKLDWVDLEQHGCVRDIDVASVLSAARQILR